jgi:hypothetical protein
VFDLLKQNKSITRTATASYVEDDKNQVLQQYFMLTFTYKLKNFGNAPAGSRQARDPMREPMMRQPMRQGPPPGE